MAKKTQGSKTPGLPYPSDIFDLAQKANLDMKTLVLLLVLRQSMNKNNRSCWKSQARLSQEMCCTRKTVIRAVKIARNRGIIRVNTRKVKKSGFLNNNYRFCYPWSDSVWDTESHTYGTESPTCKGQKVPHVRDTESHMCGTESPTNSLKAISKREINKRNSSSSLQKDDDDFFLKDSKNQAAKKKGNRKSETLTFEEKENKIREDLKKRGKDFAENAHAYADEKVDQIRPENPRAYKLAILVDLLKENPEYFAGWVRNKNKHPVEEIGEIIRLNCSN